MKDFKDGRQISIESEQLVYIANKIEDNIDYFKYIDYTYYFNEVRKIINIIDKSNKLTLL